MRQSVIAFTGISGVGKTTFLLELANLVPFQHLTAGSLIAAAREAASDRRDDLRCNDLDENQRLLIDGFSVARDLKAELVVIDGHVVIDDGESLVKLPNDVFRALDIAMMVHLEAEPRRIANNRAKDNSRSRPKYEPETLRRHQEVSRFHAKYIAESLCVSFHIVTHDDVANLATVFENQQ